MEGLANNHPEKDSNEHDIVLGEAINFKFKNRKEASDWLNNGSGSKKLLSVERNDLPGPLNKLSVKYSHGRYEPFISGSCEIEAQADQPEDFDWPNHVMAMTIENLVAEDIETYVMPHQKNTVYANIDGTLAVAIQLSETLHGHNLGMVTVNTQDIIDAHYNHYHSKPSILNWHFLPEPANNYETTKKFLRIFAAATSSVILSTGQAEPSDINNTYLIDSPAKKSKKSNKETERGEAETQNEAKPGFESIGGAFYAKRQLEDIALAFKHPEEARLFGVKTSHFMLCGPSGTGKTSLAQAFANSINAEIRSFNSTDIISKWTGESGRKVSEIFSKAKASQGLVVLFFDEFDSLARGDHGNNAERLDVKNNLKDQISSLTNYPNIIVAAATNLDPSSIDSSLVRGGRLKPIYVGTPNKDERLDIWSLKLANEITSSTPNFKDSDDIDINSANSVFSCNINIAELNKLSEGLTGADIEVIIQAAKRRCFTESISQGKIVPVTHKHIAEAINSYQKH